MSGEIHRNRRRFTNLSFRACSLRHQLDGPTRRFDLGSGPGGHPVSPYGEGGGQFAPPQNGHWMLRVVNQPGPRQCLGCDYRTRRKAGQPVEVDLLPLGAVDVGESALEGQCADERQAAALPVQASARPGPGALTLGPAAGGLALTGGGPPPYPLAFVPRAMPRPQIVGLHYSSTRNRCGMLASIPRMAGLSWCSTV